MENYEDVDPFHSEPVDDDEKKACCSRRQGRPNISDLPKLIDSKIGKVKRYTWSSGSIELFFEGLFQHGKDFPKILEHMQSKQQRKITSGTSSGLTKDQVRFFYYRTWHKVELLLSDPSLNMDKKVKGSSTVDDSSIQVDDIDISYEDGDVQLDSSLDETEDLANIHLSPKSGFDGDCIRDSETNFKHGTDSDKECLAFQSDGKRRDFILINGARQSLDLVALICYWKLKQKYPVGEHSFARKLSEMVYLGTTTIPGRVKGKRRSQIKIPSCGAFKGSISQTDKQNEEISQSCFTDSSSIIDVVTSTTPHTVAIELTPLNSKTWIKVQACSLNPRMRIHIESTKRISDIIQVLKSKIWPGTALCLNIHVCKSQSHSTNICSCSVLYGTKGDDICEGIPVGCGIDELFLKLECRKSLQLFYHIISDYENQSSESCLSPLLRIASFVSTLSERKPQFTSEKKFASNYVAEYRNLLPSLQVRKSPLSKYRKLKYRSPTKGSSTRFPKTRIFHHPVKLQKRKKNPLSNRQLIPKPLSFFPELQQKITTSIQEETEPNSQFEEDIKGAVVHNYLKEKGSKSNLIYTSSDTVNELLQGLVSDDDPSVKKLTKETSELLPTFSNALNTSARETVPCSKDEVLDQCRSVFEEASTDFISRFRELASKMDKL